MLLSPADTAETCDPDCLYATPSTETRAERKSNWPVGCDRSFKKLPPGYVFRSACTMIEYWIQRRFVRTIETELEVSTKVTGNDKPGTFCQMLTFDIDASSVGEALHIKAAGEKSEDACYGELVQTVSRAAQR